LVVAEIRRAVAHVTLDVVVHAHPSGFAQLVALGLALECGVDEIAEDLAVFQRKVEHVGDDRRWNVLGELVGGVDDVGVTHAIDEVVTELAHLVFHARHFLR
jgi:hypothetical protein